MIHENYADPVDRATIEQERLLEDNLRQARASKALVLPDTGHCYNCDDTLVSGRFCDSDCRDDYELRQSRRRANGIKV